MSKWHVFQPALLYIYNCSYQQPCWNLELFKAHRFNLAFGLMLASIFGLHQIIYSLTWRKKNAQPRHWKHKETKRIHAFPNVENFHCLENDFLAQKQSGIEHWRMGGHPARNWWATDWKNKHENLDIQKLPLENAWHKLLCKIWQYYLEGHVFHLLVGSWESMKHVTWRLGP